MLLRAKIRSYFQRAREQLRNSDVYPAYRRISSRRQEAAVEALLRRISATSSSVDAHAVIASQLAERRSKRRALPENPADATVVTFGANGWERFGLWPSFSRVFAHQSFTDEVPLDQPLICHTSAERRARGERLIQFVAEIEKKRPVNIVFTYCEPSNLDPAALEALEQKGIWVVGMGLDDRHTFAPFRQGELTVGVEKIAPAFDLYWTTWRAGILLHRSIGSRAWLGGLGADPEFYKPIQVERDIDVLFLGQSYGVRREIVWKLRRLGIDVVTRGFGWPDGFVSFDETMRLFSRARVVLGISAVGAMDHVTIMKGRDFEVPMTGACYVTQFVAELGDFFSIGRDLACYSDANGAAEQIAVLLRDEAAAERMRQSARKTAVARNTWEARLREMYGVLAGRRSLNEPR